MASVRYLALLRGINVGGKNIIRMSDLKVCFEEIGCDDVATYIQSGNVVFRSGERDVTTLEPRIERALSDRFAYESRVVLLTHRQIASVVKNAPEGFGEDPATYRYNVVFLKKPLSGAEAMESVNPKPGIDSVHAGKGVLYFSVLMRKATQSRLTRVIGLPIYKHMTIRNWNTTTTLCALLDGM